MAQTIYMHCERDSQDVLTALVRFAYEHIKTALASHSLQCCLRIRRLRVETDGGM